VGKTAQMQGKPLLYIDIDGVISLWGFDPNRRPDGAFHAVEGIVHFLSFGAARHLLGLLDAYEPVWCTGWEEKANDHLPGALGLGPFPHLVFDRDVSAGATTPGHWKLDAITEHAGGRPLAWIDDAFNAACHAWAAERGAPTLLVETQPADGLTGAQAERLRAWATRRP
jgi:hypothetical protein